MSIAGASRVFLAPFAAASLLCGCETGVTYVTPPLDTCVIDGRTGAPVRHVVVTLRSTEVIGAQHTAEADQDGCFHLPMLTGRLRVIFPFVMDRTMPVAVARFAAPGYLSKEINSVANFGNFNGQKVSLQPEK
jgi:hypothetical protein